MVDIVEWNSGCPNRRITVNTGRLEDWPPLSVAENCSTLSFWNASGVYWRLGADHWTSRGYEIAGTHHDLAVVKFRSIESQRQTGAAAICCKRKMVH